MRNNMNIQTFIGCESSFEEASTVLFGIPFDGTTSFRPGTRFAMQAIRQDSFGLESYSPYLDRDLEEEAIHDGGDLDLPFGNTERVLSDIATYTKEVLDNGKKFLMVGGEHLVSLPTIEAAYEKYPDLHVIHIDAHTDLREDYMGEPLSHASVIRRCFDFLGDGRIFQFGIRSGLKEEFEWAKEHTYMEKFTIGTFPGTGTPEPGGITYKELLAGIAALQDLNQIVAADVVELSPQYDPSGASTAMACKTVREMLLTLTK